MIEGLGWLNPSPVETSHGFIESRSTFVGRLFCLEGDTLGIGWRVEHRGYSGQAYWMARIRKGSFVRRIIGRSASRRGLLGWMLLNASRARFLFKKGLECGIFGSFLALCRRTCGYVCADGSLTWGNRRCQLRRGLGLRNYATFEGAFAHAYTSHGRIQGLLAKMVASGTMRAWAKSVHA